MPNKIESENAETWNKLASWYESTFMQFDLYNESYDLFCDQIKHPLARVLEIGCGPGNICHYLLKKEPQWQWTGIDTAANMLELAKKHNPDQHFLKLSASEIHQLDGQYDGLVMGFCLPYIPRDEVPRLFAQIVTKLKAGGIFYVSFVIGEKHTKMLQTNSKGDQIHFFYHALADISSLAEATGFQKTTEHVLDYTSDSGRVEQHAVIIFRK